MAPTHATTAFTGSPAQPNLDAELRTTRREITIAPPIGTRISFQRDECILSGSAPRRLRSDRSADLNIDLRLFGP